MNKRRQFLGALTAFGGSYILTACGGGGSDLAAGAAGDAVAKATARASTSANGTTMPPASSIVDNSGNTWTLSGGSVYRNGAKAGNTYNVSLVLFIGGVIYHQGTGSQFYAWNGSA